MKDIGSLLQDTKCNAVNEEHKKLYRPLTRAEFVDENSRYLLPFGVKADGTPFKPKATVNGFVPWPDNSPFLQVIEHQVASGRLSLDGISTFFECGTAHGRTAVAFSYFFNVVTVEMLEGKQNKREGLRYPINWIEGHGTDELKKYLVANPDERLLILLDDHTPDHGCWILQQLDVIKNNSNVKDHVILIDDYDCFGFHHEFRQSSVRIKPQGAIGDYPCFLDFVRKVEEINPAYDIRDSGINSVASMSHVFVCSV